MLRRISLTLLLAIQALGGGAITLAHTRDAVVAPPGFEASHNARCAILHDELRCALCHYASARVVTQQAFGPRRAGAARVFRRGHRPTHRPRSSTSPGSLLTH